MEYVLLVLSMVPRLVAAGHGIHFCCRRFGRHEFALLLVVMLAFSTIVLFVPGTTNAQKQEFLLCATVFIAMVNAMASLVKATDIGPWNLFGFTVQQPVTAGLLFAVLSVFQWAEHLMICRVVGI